MPSRLRILTFGFLALLGLFQSVRAGAPAAKDEWIKIKSKHFLFIGNAKEKEIRVVASKLEQFRSVFSQLFPRAKFNDSVPIVVIVFKDDNAYKPYRPTYQGKPVSVGGYFIPGRDRNYITLIPNLPGIFPYAVIYHELTHLIVNATLKPIPTWANEGLAEYYETINISEDGKTVELGNANPYHIANLRKRKLIPFQEFFRINTKSPEYNERNKQTIFYAQSWALTHYFMIGDGGIRRQKFAKLLSLLENETPIEDALREAFQTNFAELQKALENYVRSDKFYVETLRSSTKLVEESAYQRLPISEAEVFVFLGDLLSRTPDKASEAEAHLSKAIALAPDMADAYAVLGLLRLRQGREAEAEEALKRAASAPTSSPLASYYYAHFLIRRGLSSPETIAAARSALTNALAQMPDFAEGYSASAYVALAAGDLDKALADIKRAGALLPGRRDFIVLQARIYIQRREWSEAKRLLKPLAQLADDPINAAHASELLTLVNQYEQAAESGRQAALPEPTKSVYVSDDISPAGHQPKDTVTPIIPYLQRRPGTQRIEGFIERFACVQGRAFAYVRTDAGLIKLLLDFTKAELVAHTDDVGDVIGCDSKIPNPVIVMYRPTTQPVADEAGEVVSLEFLPRPK
ncbi:MAG: tetratricopeptide repeat protein [Chloracidobacterium sp.]|nr:tetratricopeptide repeat protein [Chloracidobacterium sp.]MDW8217519.1 tetratricopeptide repeat protein [Acidobacteriota bacterium]